MMNSISMTAYNCFWATTGENAYQVKQEIYAKWHNEASCPNRYCVETANKHLDYIYNWLN